MRSPSGDQHGRVDCAPNEVNCIRLWPSLSDVQSSIQPMRLELKTSFLPSGEYCGECCRRVVGANFLGDPGLAIASVCWANIWRGVPFFGITILAGLQAVPQELHEAAAIDGASVWHRFRHVTIPSIKGVVLIASLLSIIWTFADFQLIYILTKGGPANETHIFGTYTYQIGLSATEIGMGAAISLYMFPVLAFFAILLLIYLRKEQ